MKDEKLEKVFAYAKQKHKNQKRKGTDIPYFVHLLDVAAILHGEVDDEENNHIIAAGLLHDVVEDKHATESELRRIFGKMITGIVMEVTEKDKSLPWKARKEQQIEAMKTASKEARLVKLADMLSNIKSIIHDYKQIGDKVWKRFNAGKDEQEFYYKGMLNALKCDSDIYKEYKKAVDTLFSQKIKKERDIEYETLLFLRINYGKSFRISEIAEKISVTSEEALKAVNRLESNGLIYDRWIDSGSAKIAANIISKSIKMPSNKVLDALRKLEKENLIEIYSKDGLIEYIDPTSHKIMIESWD
jgi:DNA-binding MarR family transcriptional regulator